MFPSLMKIVSVVLLLLFLNEMLKGILSAKIDQRQPKILPQTRDLT